MFWFYWNYIYLGKLPVGLLFDQDWDQKAYGYLDPTGNNCMNQVRDVKLTNLQFIEQRLLNCNTSFARCTSFLYASLAFIELSQLNSRVNISVQRGARRKTAGGGIEYNLQDAFQIFDTISNSVRLVNSIFYKYIPTVWSIFRIGTMKHFMGNWNWCWIFNFHGVLSPQKI